MAIIKPKDVLSHLKKKQQEESAIKKTARNDVMNHFKKKVYPRLEDSLNRQLQSEKFDIDDNGNLTLLTYFSDSIFFNMKSDNYNIVRSYRFSSFNESGYIKLSSNLQTLSKDSLFYLDLISPFIHKIEDSGYLVTNVRASGIHSLNSIQLSLTITIPKGA